MIKQWLAHEHSLSVTCLVIFIKCELDFQLKKFTVELVRKNIRNENYQWVKQNYRLYKKT